METAIEKFRVNTLEVDIGKVIPNSWNPKDAVEESKANEERFNQIKKGIVEHGLMMPITVRKIGADAYEIIDGYHRYRACKELGYSKILVNNLGEVKDEIAKALTILFERAKVEPNTIKEAELLKNIYELIPDYSEMAKILPFDAEVIENKIQLIEHDWDQYGENAQGGGEGQDDGMARFAFKISAEEAEICYKALSLAGEDKESAFIEICRSYAELGGIEGQSE